jgi:hypothetical protein
VLAAVGLIAVAGGGAGAFLGLRAAHTAAPGSGTAAAPSPRAYAAAAYDEATHQVVLFGGMGEDSSALGDTWTWDGATWTEQHPSVSPAARAFAAMTYDPHSHDVILVGGRQLSKPAGPETCSARGSAGAGGAGPGAQAHQALPPGAAPTPKPTSGPVVVRPTTVSAAPSPIALPPATVTVAPDLQLPTTTDTEAPAPVSCPPSNPAELDDTWRWDGSRWHQASPPTPSGMLGSTPEVATDPSTGQVLLLTPAEQQPSRRQECPVTVTPVLPGGAAAASPPPGCEPPVVTPGVIRTWSWNGSGWSALGATPPATGAALVGASSLVADPISGHLALFRFSAFVTCAMAPAQSDKAMPCPLSAGGAVLQPSGAPSSVPCCPATETIWNGNQWSQPTTLTAVLPILAGAGLVGDPASHTVLAFDQQGTWTWSGTKWTAAHPTRVPPLVSGGTLVYDGGAGRVLLFGGLASLGAADEGKPPYALPTQLTDVLWSWDGANWTVLQGTPPSASPAPTPTPTFVPPATPAPTSPSPSRSPLPTTTAVPCSPAATPGFGAIRGCGSIVPPPVPG